MKTKIKWYDAAKVLPAKSMDNVLVKYSRSGVMNVSFSAVLRKFNCNDDGTGEGGFDVELWAYNPFCAAENDGDNE